MDGDTLEMILDHIRANEEQYIVMRKVDPTEPERRDQGYP